MMRLKIYLAEKVRHRFYALFPELVKFADRHKTIINSSISEKAKLHGSYDIRDSQIDAYTYLAGSSAVHTTVIGKFCSIGKNFNCGLGIHPTAGISTSPSFYTVEDSNGLVLAKTEKFKQRKNIIIGSDVWIGINVTIVDGVKIGDGSVIGAGSVVTQDVPDYAVVAGIPAKLIKFRFDINTIAALKQIKWWEFPEEDLVDVEENFFNVSEFINKFNVR